MDNIRVDTNIEFDILYKLIEINILNQSTVNEILQIKNKIETIEYEDNTLDNFNYISTLTGLLNIKHIIKLNKDKEYNLDILKLLFIQNSKIKIRYNDDLISIDKYIERKMNDD